MLQGLRLRLSSSLRADTGLETQTPESDQSTFHNIIKHSVNSQFGLYSIEIESGLHLHVSKVSVS